MNTNNIVERALFEVMRREGTMNPQAAVARLLGVSAQAVSAWKKKGRVPVERVLKLSELSGLPPHEIRPDIYPATTN